MAINPTPEGWYADPANPALLRYWNGTSWTEHTHPVAQPEAPVTTSQETDLYSITLGQVTSFIVVTSRKTLEFTGTVEELEARYRKVLLHNLLLGWWGFPFGFVWTPMWLWRNRKARTQLREIVLAD